MKKLCLLCASVEKIPALTESQILALFRAAYLAGMLDSQNGGPAFRLCKACDEAADGKME